MENVCDIRSGKIMSKKSWIPTKRSVIKDKGRKPVPAKWVFKSKAESGGLISLK